MHAHCCVCVFVLYIRPKPTLYFCKCTCTLSKIIICKHVGVLEFTSKCTRSICILNLFFAYDEPSLNSAAQHPCFWIEDHSDLIAETRTNRNEFISEHESYAADLPVAYTEWRSYDRPCAERVFAAAELHETCELLLMYLKLQRWIEWRWKLTCLRSWRNHTPHRGILVCHVNL